MGDKRRSEYCGTLAEQAQGPTKGVSEHTRHDRGSKHLTGIRERLSGSRLPELFQQHISLARLP